MVRSLALLKQFASGVCLWLVMLPAMRIPLGDFYYGHHRQKEDLGDLTLPSKTSLRRKQACVAKTCWLQWLIAYTGIWITFVFHRSLLESDDTRQGKDVYFLMFIKL